MKSLITALSLCALSTSAIAQAARPNLYTMSCSAAGALVQARGAVVANTSQNMFQRLVTSAGYCQHGETAEPYFSPTTDRPMCLVGYECRDIASWEDNK